MGEKVTQPQTQTPEDLWKSFTASPLGGSVEVQTVWPYWRYVAPCKCLYYLSDKWGKGWTPYFHNTTSHLWEPGKGGRAPRPRPEDPPRSKAAILAYCLGWDVQKRDGNYRATTEFGDLLCAFTSHRKTYIFVVDIRGQVTALFEGDRLKILPEGISG